MKHNIFGDYNGHSIVEKNNINDIVIQRKFENIQEYMEKKHFADLMTIKFKEEHMRNNRIIPAMAGIAFCSYQVLVYAAFQYNKTLGIAMTALDIFPICGLYFVSKSLGKKSKWIKAELESYEKESKEYGNMINKLEAELNAQYIR